MPFRRFAIVCALCALPCPALADEKPAKPGYGITPDVVYGHKDGLALTFDMIRPKNANKAGIMIMVSGGWVSRWFPPEIVAVASPMFREGVASLLKKGYTLFLVRHGSSPRYKVPDAVKDVRLALNHIRTNAEKLGIDPERLGVIGGSAGGHLSLMLGTKPTTDDAKKGNADGVAAVVALFPPTNLTNYIGPNERFPALEFDKKLAKFVSPLFHVSPGDAPTLLIHGDKDTLVPLSESENIEKAFAKEEVPCELIVIKGAGHGFKGDDEKKAAEAMVKWFDRYLAATGGSGD